MILGHLKTNISANKRNELLRAYNEKNREGLSAIQPRHERDWI